MVASKSVYQFYGGRKSLYSDKLVDEYDILARDQWGRTVRFKGLDNGCWLCLVYAINQVAAYDVLELGFKMPLIFNSNWNRKLTANELDPSKLQNEIKAQQARELELERQKVNIEWYGNWGIGCLFNTGNTHTISFKKKAEDCGPKCENFPICTHFEWKPYSGGLSYLDFLKSITKSRAYFDSSKKMVCDVNPNWKKWHIQRRDLLV